MLDLSTVGTEWLADQIDEITEAITHVDPITFNEENRYLPDSVTPIPGPMSFAINPYMRELIAACDPRSDVREVNLKKGVQITYTTLLESILLYYIAYIKTRPCMLVSVDKEAVKIRIENYILPMLAQSDLAHLIQSSDEGNSRKTGKTATHLQWKGGGFLIPGGANNADKMRSWSIMLMLKDEIDGWAQLVGKDGEPDSLTDDRCASFWNIRKIFRGSTPLIKGISKIDYQYSRGDQRHYHVLCKHCNFPQALRWATKHKDTGVVGGFMWDMDDGTLVLESVRYLCQECGGEHYEQDKTKLFAEEHGAKWVPTARPVEPGIRSYLLPAFYSPVGMQPWSRCVGAYLSAFNPETNKVRDIGKYQTFYNNVLAESFEVKGQKVGFEQVSAHRRPEYSYGEIPNTWAMTWCGSKVLFLTCQVDVHDKNLAVAVMGWTDGARCLLIDYWRFEDEDCTDISSPAWQRLRDLLEEKVYIADDGIEYRINRTFVDAGYAQDTVIQFCGRYQSGVYPILGRDRPGKNQSIKEFADWATRAGTVGYKLTVDHYKDRMGLVLRRDWVEDMGVQHEHHFNCPHDTSDIQLKELTVEVRRKKVGPGGAVTYEWHRPGNARNELWDLLGYGYACVEVRAWEICIQYLELEKFSWAEFWGLAANPNHNELFGRVGF